MNNSKVKLGTVVWNGTAGGDYHAGTAGQDHLSGLGGNDTLRGAGGADILLGGAGDDRLYSNAGDIRVDGGSGTDYAELDFSSRSADLVFRVSDNLGTDVIVAGTAIRDIERITFTGGSGADLVQGGAGNDQIYGGSGNDTLGGLGGRNLLDGGDGDDRLVTGSGIDVIRGGAGIDTVSIIRTASIKDITFTLLPAVQKLDNGTTIEEVERLEFTSGAGNDSITGGELDDIIAGGTGHDTLVGGAGADTLLGGGGDDVIAIGGGADHADGGSGFDMLLVDRTGTAQGYGVVLTNPSQTKTLLDGTTVVNFERLTFKGGSGGDTMTGGQYADVLEGNDGNDLIDGAGGNDVIKGGAGNDWITGGNGDDTIHSGQGVDHIDAGNDFDDEAYIDRSNVTIALNLDQSNTAVRQVLADGTSVKGVQLMHFWSGSGHDKLVGGLRSDELHGGAGNDTLDGGTGGWNELYGDTGDDTLLSRTAGVVDGGAGTDLALLNPYDTTQNLLLDISDPSVDQNFAGITVRNVERIQAFGSRGNDTITGGSLEDMLSGGTGNDVLNGGGGNDWITGGEGHDSLISGAGVDHLDGGAGLDEAVVDRGYLTQSLSADLRNASVGQTLADGTFIRGIERITLTTGSGHDTITGTLYGDVLTGGAGNDVLDGWYGFDRLDGGAGDDVLTGGDGDDIIISSEGADTLSGGGGDDMLVLDRTGVLTDLRLDMSAAGAVQLLGDGTSITGFEELRFTGGSGDDTVTGSWRHDEIAGGDGDDVIDGGTGGWDFLTGGAGNDTLVLRYSGRLDGGSGIDFADISLANIDADVTFDFSTPGMLQDSGGLQIQDIEQIRLTLGAGSDEVTGGARADFIDGGEGQDLLAGANGNDSLLGAGGADYLTGGAGRDVLRGGTGADTLAGGSGHDTLVGGTGADRFLFVAADGNDVITDFEVSGGDVLDLSQIAEIHDATELSARLHGNAAGDVVIETGTGSSIALLGVTLFEFSASDVILAPVPAELW